MESIWKNRKFSLFGPFWPPQNGLGWPAGWSGSKGTPFKNTLLKTLLFIFWFQSSPIVKISEPPEFFCKSLRSHKFQPKRWRFRWVFLRCANGRILVRARAADFFFWPKSQISILRLIWSQNFPYSWVPPLNRGLWIQFWHLKSILKTSEALKPKKVDFGVNAIS